MKARMKKPDPSLLRAAVAQAKNERRKLPKPKKLAYPDLIQRRYEAILRKWARGNAERVAAILAPALAWAEAQEAGARDDGPIDWLKSLLEKARKTIFASLGPLKVQILGIAKDIDTQNKNAVNRQFREVLGLDPVKSPAQLATLKSWEQQNRILIRNNLNGEIGKLKNRVIEAVRSGTPTKKLAKAIEQFGDVSESRAVLLARDQVGKLVGQITRERHEGLGVTSYIWQTSKDERVVGNPAGLYPTSANARHGNHWEREGKVFKYSDPPEDGNPGEPIQCRCVAIPVIPGL